MALGPGTGEFGRDAGGKGTGVVGTGASGARGPEAGVSGTESFCRFVFFLVSILRFTWGFADLVLFIGSMRIRGGLDGFVRFKGLIRGVGGLALEALL